MHLRTSALLRPVTSASPFTVGSSRISRQPRTIRAAGERTAHAGMPPTRPIRSDPIMKADFSCFFSAPPPSSLGAMPARPGSQLPAPGRCCCTFLVGAHSKFNAGRYLKNPFYHQATIESGSPCVLAEAHDGPIPPRLRGVKGVCARRLMVLRPDAWRRGRDSNPRYGITVHTLSRRAP